MRSAQKRGGDERLRERLPALLRVLRLHGVRHRRWLAAGAGAAVGVIGARLALPWLVKSLVKSWLSPETTTGAAGMSLESVALAGLACLALCAILGLSDHLERLWFARYAIGLVRDLRRAAFAAALGPARPEGRKERADLLARLVSDAARAKAGLKGFLVHVATGGLLLVGVIAILLGTAPELAAVFAAGCLLLAAVTAVGAGKLYASSARHRRREGKLAGLIARALRGKREEEALEKVNRRSGRAEASATRTQGRTTLVAHLVFGSSVLVGLLLGLGLVESGRLAAEEMVVFVLYSFMMRRPMVQLARQGARTGKILASVARLEEVLARVAPAERLDVAAAPSAGEGLARAREATPALEEWVPASRPARTAGARTRPQAVILAAGVGRRLGNAAGGLPKCLLEVGGKPLLHHQLDALRGLGIHEVCVVVGHRAHLVRSAANGSCTYVENPRFAETNSLVSLWLARSWVRGPLLVVNGDVLAHPSIYRLVADTPGNALAFDSGTGKDLEHMKVVVRDGRVRAMGKHLDPATSSGENVGILKFDGDGAAQLMERAGEILAAGGLQSWAPAAVDGIVDRCDVWGVDVVGLPWIEIDFADDLAVAGERVWPAIRRRNGFSRLVVPGRERDEPTLPAIAPLAATTGQAAR